MLSWNLPSGVTGRLQDVILGTLIDQAMSGSGSYTVANPSGFTKLKMTVTYSPQAVVPAVTTSAASNVTTTGAQLNGTVNPNGASTTYYFEYGTTVSYGSQTNSASAGSGTSAANVNATLSGLAPGTTYHYRLVATSSVGTSRGNDMTFTTTSSSGGGVDLSLTVSDGSGGSQQLRFGLDPSATDGIDGALGESELPPMPPSGVFDARFIGDDIGLSLGQGILKDYRQGSAATSGVRIYEIKYQVGIGASIVISWNLPNGVTGRLQDVIVGTLIDQAMSGSGSYTVSNPGGFSKLKYDNLRGDASYRDDWSGIERNGDKCTAERDCEPEWINYDILLSVWDNDELWISDEQCKCRIWIKRDECQCNTNWVDRWDSLPLPADGD